ncbi:MULTISPECIES: transposase [unclassified Streptomyces]|uniref:transposase n=1 Tax=unclassified Streptomyces TaxID=2593676 RepID=UPI002252349C|nr:MULTISPECIES: transposase [unclassified Streptomyces]MCX5336411.1 hypothetical protein [Streptomyces sp. NBC_00140]MCX5367134.1 hypothetical protein [Streptomyces sp. NBC_00124]
MAAQHSPGQVARASNPGATTATWVRDRLDGLWCDEDFATWYPRDARPGLSPAQLATVCVLQFVPALSDRQAAETVRCRIDFKSTSARSPGQRPGEPWAPDLGNSKILDRVKVGACV